MIHFNSISSFSFSSSPTTTSYPSPSSSFYFPSPSSYYSYSSSAPSSYSSYSPPTTTSSSNFKFKYGEIVTQRNKSINQTQFEDLISFYEYTNQPIKLCILYYRNALYAPNDQRILLLNDCLKRIEILSHQYSSSTSPTPPPPPLSSSLLSSSSSIIISENDQSLSSALSDFYSNRQPILSSTLYGLKVNIRNHLELSLKQQRISRELDNGGSVLCNGNVNVERMSIFSSYSLVSILIISMIYFSEYDSNLPLSPDWVKSPFQVEPNIWKCVQIIGMVISKQWSQLRHLYDNSLSLMGRLFGKIENPELYIFVIIELTKKRTLIPKQTTISSPSSSSPPPSFSSSSLSVESNDITSIIIRQRENERKEIESLLLYLFSFIRDPIIRVVWMMRSEFFHLAYVELRNISKNVKLREPLLLLLDQLHKMVSRKIRNNELSYSIFAGETDYLSIIVNIDTLLTSIKPLNSLGQLRVTS